MDYIFDFFGTLITNNIKFYNKIMSTSFGLNIQEFKDKIRIFISTNKFDSKEEALNSLLEHLNVKFSSEQKTKFFSYLDSWKKSLRLYDGAIEVLKKLRKRNSKIVILSNNNTMIQDVLKIKSINEYADIIILSHEVCALKPDKKIYQICINKLKTTPDNITIVGDQLEKDVLVPEKFGMHGILFDPDNKYPDYNGRKINSLKKLLK